MGPVGIQESGRNMGSRRNLGGSKDPRGRRELGGDRRNLGAGSRKDQKKCVFTMAKTKSVYGKNI